MQHWLPFLNNSNQKILFNGRALGSILEKRLTTSLLPTLKPVLKPTLPSYTIYSKFLPFHPWHFMGLPFRASRGPAIHAFLVLLPPVVNHLNVAYGQCWPPTQTFLGIHHAWRDPGTRDEPLRTSAWEARECKMTLVYVINYYSTMPCGPGFSLTNW